MARKASKIKPVQSLNYTFEITEFRPTYMLSLNPRLDDKRPWWEHASLEFFVMCRHPNAIAGRLATFQMVADREFWTPSEMQIQPDWRPQGVGLLDLSPRGGRFYAPIPHDSFSEFLTALAHGLYRFIVLRGPPLWRGKSLCTSLELKRVIDIGDD